MEFNFKKWLWVLALFIGLGIYIRTHYTFEDLLTYSKNNPHPTLSPKIDYYVGMSSYLRSKYPLSKQAFEQLLTDYPTCQYAPKALFRLGNIYAEQRQWDKARELYRNYLEQYPEGPHAGIVRSKYEVIKFR
jgi:TolA-binding protein